MLNKEMFCKNWKYSNHGAYFEPLKNTMPPAENKLKSHEVYALLHATSDSVRISSNVIQLVCALKIQAKQVFP